MSLRDNDSDCLAVTQTWPQLLLSGYLDCNMGTWECGERPVESQVPHLDLQPSKEALRHISPAGCFYLMLGQYCVMEAGRCLGNSCEMR